MNQAGSDDLATGNVRAYRFGEFKLDLVDETLQQNDQTLNLNRRMFQVLVLLIEKRGEIVTKDVFFEKVWSGSFVEDNNLTVTIAALRRVLGDDARQAKFIENIPRKGYRFIAPVDIEHDPSEEQALAAERAGDSSIVQTLLRRRVLTFGVAAVGLFIVLSVAGLGIKPFWRTRSADRRINSVAVLPFENKDPNGEYLADGLTDSISDALSKVPGLRVINRNSTYHYKNANADPIATGTELGVESVVSGQIDYQAEVPTVNIILTDVAANGAVLQQQFRLPPDEVLSVQQEIIRVIAQNLDRGEQVAAAKHPTDNPEAYDLYIKGRYYWNKRTNPDIIKSAEFFQAAIDEDPNFAKAYIGLADAYALGGFTGISNEQRNALARSNVRKALDLDDTLGEGYAVIALGQCYSDWNFAEAEQNYRRAVELSPNDATAHHWYAEFLSMQGYLQSNEEYALAMSLDPLSLPIRTDMAFSVYYGRDFDHALELLNQAKELDPDYNRTYYFLSFVYREKGMFVEAADSIQRRYELETQKGEYGPERLTYLKKHTAALRDGAKANGAEGYWRAVANSDFTIKAGPYVLAVAYAKLGENDEAFKQLEIAFRQHSSDMVWLKVDPELDSLRQDPRYYDLLKRVGF